jgi:hypothetical protein
MLNIYATMMNVATRQQDWPAPDRWRHRDAPDRRKPDEVKRDRTRTRRAFRLTGIM